MSKIWKMLPQANSGGANSAPMIQGYDSDDEGRAFLESLRWPAGAICPSCGANEPYKLNPKLGSKSPARKGLYKCRSCRRQFTVTVGTLFEDSRIALNKWLMAIFSIRSSKGKISIRRLTRVLGISYKSTHVMTQRILTALAPASPAGAHPQIVREKQMVLLRTTPLKKLLSTLLQKKPASRNSRPAAKTPAPAPLPPG